MASVPSVTREYVRIERVEGAPDHPVPVAQCAKCGNCLVIDYPPRSLIVSGFLVLINPLCQCDPENHPKLVTLTEADRVPPDGDGRR